jgi:hypothetical protein
MNLYLQSLIQRRDDLACLEYPFTKEEIDDVVRKMLIDKVLGPSGFNGAFI